MLSLQEGIASPDLTVSTQCCSAIDRLISYRFNVMPPKEKDQNSLANMEMHIKENMDKFTNISIMLVRRLLFEDCQNQWSVSRPLFSIVILNPDVIYFLEFSNIGSISRH